MELLEYKKKTYQEIKEEIQKECGTCPTDDFVSKLQDYLKKQEFSNSVTFYKDYIQANSFVGIIKYKNFQLEILPKLLAHIEEENGLKDSERVQILKNLIFMLSYTKNLEIKISDNAKLSNSKNPFLEILIKEFASSLFDALKRFTPKNYIRQEDNLNYLKGKLKFSQNLRYNCANQAKFYCEFDEFSENNILNKLFLYVSTCLFNISKDSNNKKLLKFIMNYYCDIDLIKFDKFKANKIILSKNQQLFVKPFKLAKMFIEHSSVDLSKNKIDNITLLWDMNLLFEEFIYELIRKNCDGYNVNYQVKRKLLQSCDNNKNYGDTYVDVFIEKDNQKIILDTKYKINSGQKNDFKNADIYQVITYSLIHGTKNAMLLYPSEGAGYDYSRHVLNRQEENDKKLQWDDNNYKILLCTINLQQDIKSNLTGIVEKLNSYMTEFIK